MCEAIEGFNEAQQDNNDLLISSLKKIPQLAEMRKEHLQTQCENTLKEFSHSNVAQLKDSDGNQITQTTQNNSGSGDNMQASRDIIQHYNYASSAPEKPCQINDDKYKELIIELLELIIKNQNDPHFFKLYQLVEIHRSNNIQSFVTKALIHHSELVVLLYISIYSLKATRKLTDNRIDMILQILEQMPPKIICRENIKYDQRHEVYLLYNAQARSEKFNPNCYTLCNTSLIDTRLQEIKNGEWDPFIKTSIEELG